MKAQQECVLQCSSNNKLHVLVKAQPNHSMHWATVTY